MSILKFSQDRTADFNEESKKIYKVIEDFGDDENLKPLLTHFEKKYSLPKEVTKKRIKKLIALRYKYKSAKFDRSLLLRNLFYQFFKVIYIFIRLIFYTNKSTGIKHYKIIVDDVRDDLQLMRFEKLINYFGKDS